MPENMKRARLLFALILSVVVGCGPEKPNPDAAPAAASDPAASANGGGGKGPASASGGASQVAQADLDAVPRASKPYKLVLIVKTKNNPFFIPMIAAFQKTVQEMGVHGEVQAADKEESYEQQVALVQAETARGAQAILITPADSIALVPALKQAQERGVLVINLDNRLDPAAVKAQGLALGGYVGADNQAGGRLAGDALAAALNGSGKVAVIEGIRSADNARARKQGFEAAAAGKLQIVDEQTGQWSTETAHDRAQAILAKHPDLAGIFCANDDMAIGAAKAVDEAGRTGKVRVVGYDNIPSVRRLLDSGKLTATIEQHPDLMGRYGVRMAVGLLDGKLKPCGDFLVPLQTISSK